jgi:siroheme synthase
MISVNTMDWGIERKRVIRNVKANLWTNEQHLKFQVSRLSGGDPSCFLSKTSNIKTLRSDLHIDHHFKQHS